MWVREPPSPSPDRKATATVDGTLCRMAEGKVPAVGSRDEAPRCPVPPPALRKLCPLNKESLIYPRREDACVNINAHIDGSLEIIAFRLNDQSFCVKTRSIREIRGWVPVTPMPHAPYEVLGVINLRGMVIPVIDLAAKLGMAGTEASERSAIIVTDVNGMTMGLLVEGVSDILTVPATSLQPVPSNAGQATQFVEGILTHQDQMICFLNLEELFSADGLSVGGGGGGGGAGPGWEEF